MEKARLFGSDYLFQGQSPVMNAPVEKSEL